MSVRDKIRRLAEAKAPKKTPHDPWLAKFADLADHIEEVASGVEDEPYTFDHDEVLRIIDDAMDLMPEGDEIEKHLDLYDAVDHAGRQLKEAVAHAAKAQNALKQAASDVADALRGIAVEFPTD